jgi:roadblock/LC7 domain-containing protein
LAAARAAAKTEIEEYLDFTAGFATDYGRFDEILLIGFDSLNWIPGQYTVAEVDEHLVEFYTAVAAVGFSPDAALVETYRSWALSEIAEYLALLTTIPSEITDAYSAAQTAITGASDPFVIRDAVEDFVSMVTPLL